MYHGDIRLGDTIDIKFSTVSTTGAPTTLAGSPTIAAYPGNSTTEVTAGITLTVDFDARTGLHNVRVVATGGNGYATATNYALVITAGTVGGTSVVGYVIGTFSIEARSALMPTTAARTLVVDAAGLADANAVKLGPTGSGTAQTARDVGAQLDAAVTTRMATFTLPANFSSLSIDGSGRTDLGKWLGSAPDALSSGKVPADVKLWLAVAMNALIAGRVDANAQVVGDKTAYALTSAERTAIADALLDETNGVETSYTLRQVLRVMFSALGGKCDGGATTTMHYRDQADGKNRITATVDANGNRTAVTLDAS